MNLISIPVAVLLLISVEGGVLAYQSTSSHDQSSSASKLPILPRAQARLQQDKSKDHNLDFSCEQVLPNAGNAKHVNTKQEAGKAIARMCQSTHGGFFKCDPCICWRDATCKINANCSNLGLTFIPQTLPKQVQLIDLSYNFLNHFNTSSISRYLKLLDIDLSRNAIHKIVGSQSNGHVKQPFSLKVLNMDHNRISIIHDNSFRSFSDLLTLQLSNNKMITITNGTFNGLKKLYKLDMSNNFLKFIADGAFDVFACLKNIYLNGNHRLGYLPKLLKPRLFHKLKNVETLHIQGCSNGNLYYPNDVFKEMPRLKELIIDGIDKPLFTEPMMQLETLIFGSHAFCFFHNLTQKLFRNIPNLAHFSATFCHFHSIDSDAFAFNPYLKSFELVHVNTYDLDNAFDYLKQFQNTSIKTLKLQHLYHSVSCRALNAKNGRYMKKLKLEELDLSGNRIYMLGNDFLDTLPITLRRLNLSGNLFTMAGNIWHRIPFLVNLDTIDISSQNNDWRNHQVSSELDLLSNYLDHRFDRDGSSLSFSIDNSSVDYMSRFSQSQGQRHVHLRYTMERKKRIKVRIHNDLELPRCHNIYNPDSHESVVQREKRLPPNLKTVIATRYLGFGQLLLYTYSIGPNSLTNLFFSNAYMTEWGAGKLPSSVKYIDFSHNHCNVLKFNFFPINNSLINLKINNNHLGVTCSEDEEGRLFSRLTRLLYLDISSNSIFRLSSSFLQGLNNLKTLDLSENKIRVLNLTFSHMNSIDYVNFGQNAIHYISESTRNDLDIIASRKRLRINFKDNSIPCTCDGLPILKWMSKTKVVLSQKYFLTCINFEGKVERIGDITLRYKSLLSTCKSEVSFFVAACILVPVLLSFIAAALIYRNRWKLRYIKNRYFIKTFGFKPKSHPNSSYQFDVYVLYDESDHLFVLQDVVNELHKKRNHKVCVEDIDFIPGTYVTNNITCAIQNSTVTLLIVSPASLASDEVEYAVQMAVMEEYFSQNKRCVLHLLMYKDSDKKSFSADLLSLLRQGRFLEYPTSDSEDVTDEAMSGFWDTLSNSIGHTSNKESRPMLNPGV